MGYRIWGHRMGYYVLAHQYPSGDWHNVALFGDDALHFEREMESVNDRYTLADLVGDMFIGHPSFQYCHCDMHPVPYVTRHTYSGHTLLYWGD